MRARSALFTLFGDVVRPRGGEAWLTSLTAAMGTLGFTAQATRTALHRMGTDGWVEPRRSGRYAAYRLTARGEDRLEEAAERIFRLRAAPWDGRWRLLELPLPAEDPARAALRWMGFGQLRDALWVSPHDHGDRLTVLLDEHGATPTALAFDATGSAGPGDDSRIVARAWDLSALRAAHEGFLEEWSARSEPPDEPAAFATRIRLVHHWRSFLFLDPGLPAALLPSDWPGDDATACFHRRYAEVAEPAARWWAATAADAPGAAAA